MSRMHAHTHGKSHSVRPVSINVPNWLTQDYSEVSSLILQLSKEGLLPSEIGVRLREHHGIPLAKPIIGKSITKVLSESGDRKSTRLNSSHLGISYAVFC